MSCGLSFAPAIFRGEYDEPSPRPTNVHQALVSLSAGQWVALAREVFHCPARCSRSGNRPAAHPPDQFLPQSGPSRGGLHRPGGLAFLARVLKEISCS